MAPQECPCGYLGDTRRRCRCTPQDVRKYRSRVSGPLLDRIDLHVDVPAVAFDQLAEGRRGELPRTVQARVQAAREPQMQRLRGSATRHNGAMAPKEIEAFATPTAEGLRVMKLAMEKLNLSARAYTRVLKVARTIADLAGAATVEVAHVSEAIQYRQLDRGAV